MVIYSTCNTTWGDKVTMTYPSQTRERPAYLKRYGLKLMDDQMLTSIPPGRYAWQPDSETPLTFVWIKRYTSGKRNGQLRVRSQHGPWYEDELTRLYDGKVIRWDDEIESVLIGVFCDRFECAQRYAQEMRRCWSCNLELTVGRSRWYGMGPECEKRLAWYIEDVDNKKGFTFEERKLHGIGEDWDD